MITVVAPAQAVGDRRQRGRFLAAVEVAGQDEPGGDLVRELLPYELRLPQRDVVVSRDEVSGAHLVLPPGDTDTQQGKLPRRL
nr:MULTISPECIES: hypothetical protein [unclassified Streptomyces]